MNTLIRAAAALAVAIGLSGCATVSPSPTPRQDDPYAATREAVANHPELPGEGHLLPSAELITFAYEADGTTRRDTIRGAQRVALWLESLRARTADSRSEFGLEPREILICEGGAVERGYFPMPDRIISGPGGDREYLALWRADGEEWKLDRLLLSPTSIAPSQLASGCRAGIVKPLGLVLGASFGLGTPVDLAAVEANVMALPGYDESERSEGFSQPQLQLWGAVPLGASVTGRFSYGYVVSGEMQARNFFQDALREERTFEASMHRLSAIAEVQVGPVGIGAGPVAAATVLSMTHYFSGRSQPTVESETLFHAGAMAQMTWARPLAETFRARALLEYTYFPEIEPAWTTTESLDMGGLGLSVGVEWIP